MPMPKKIEKIAWEPIAFYLHKKKDLIKVLNKEKPTRKKIEDD